jgi:hypothetical protein
MQLPHGKQQQQQQQDETLLTAIKAVFEGGGVANSSNYLPLVLLFPLLAPLVQWLAFRWPDAKLARLAKVRPSYVYVWLQLDVELLLRLGFPIPRFDSCYRASLSGQGMALIWCCCSTTLTGTSFTPNWLATAALQHHHLLES